MKEPLDDLDDLDDPEEEKNFRADLVLVLSIVATFVLYRLPYSDTLAWPLVLLSTLAHELGHGLTALVLGGKFSKLVINSDTSGVAWTHTTGHISRALVCAGGLLGPAIAAAFLFGLARRAALARASLVVLGAALAATVPTLVEGAFGKTFVALVAAAFLAIGVRAPGWFARHALAFVAVQLSLSVWSRSDYLFTPVARMATGDRPSDVAKMAEHLGMPYWFWGGVCAVFSVIVLFVGARFFLRGVPLPKVKRRSPGPESLPGPSDIRSEPGRDRARP